MAHRRVELRVETGPLGGGDSWALATTVHLPPPDRLTGNAPVLFALPGGGYNRRYFDLRSAGYSEAEHHVARGVVVVAIDHLGVGESDIPAPETISLAKAAAANHAVLQVIVERLRTGQLAEGVAPISVVVVIGEGQSMGGHIAILMQANHRSFDGLAILGSSVVCTRLPAAAPGRDVCLLGKQDIAEGLAGLHDLDWRFAFHWEDVPEQFAGADSHARNGTGPLPYWSSATCPDARDGMLPGFLAREVAAIHVPVLIGMGERDVCQDPLRELAAFMSTRDLALFVGRKMGHMHNFAGTRQYLWRRISAFIAQVSDLAQD